VIVPSSGGCERTETMAKAVQEIASMTCAECERQAAGSFGPSHLGSKRCESGSLASGGPKVHCTCEACF
jgi:hypothetical protein